MVKTQLYIPEWLMIKPETRMELRKMFDLKEDIGREVQNNQCICDGISNNMLANITLEKINEWLNQDFTDYMSAINTLIAKIEAPKEPAVTVVSTPFVPTTSGNSVKIDKRSKAYKESLKINK